MTVKIELTLTDEEHAKLELAATEKAKPVGDFILDEALRVADIDEESEPRCVDCTD